PFACICDFKTLLSFFPGWQPRWFLLAGGVLSYYDSREDAWKGCKGSIQMAVCEIQVHSTDNTRMDLMIPGEQCFYLKAKDTAERQKWLVALGTAKACLTDIRTLKEKEFTENTEMLKTKMAELRLYCDLLVQQVEKIKATTITSHVQHGINMGVLLNSSCATFLKTLEECMQIANAAFSSELLQHTPGETSYSVIRKLNKVSLCNLRYYKILYELATYVCIWFRIWFAVLVTFESIYKLMTLFSDIKLFDDGGIPTEEFLNSCYEIVPVLDKLGPTVFAPVKMDFEGNIKKINQKYITNKEDFCTLQKIVLHDLSTEVAQIRHSATQALLWLKRGLKFLKEFLTELKNGEKNIQTALNKSYSKTLRQYHGWVVRGVFALALRASPTYAGFVAALSLAECENQEEAFYHGMQRDLNIYLPAMEKQLNILDALYEEHGLESDEVV
uniref:Pleckstrin homology domain-containing family A member 8 n=1 Tax=Naja naja TaxID=35670 RepID=A0A8C6Y0J1_NAJNA